MFAKATTGSSKNITPNWLIAAVNGAPSMPSRWTSATTKRTFAAPRSRARCAAKPTSGTEISAPTTDPVAPTPSRRPARRLRTRRSHHRSRRRQPARQQRVRRRPGAHLGHSAGQLLTPRPHRGPVLVVPTSPFSLVVAAVRHHPPPVLTGRPRSRSRAQSTHHAVRALLGETVTAPALLPDATGRGSWCTR
jgi:hypothetical protein